MKETCETAKVEGQVTHAEAERPHELFPKNFPWMDGIAAPWAPLPPVVICVSISSNEADTPIPGVLWLSNPRINDGNSDVFEMAGIACGQAGMVGKRNSGDDGIAELTWATFSLPSRHKVRRLCCCSCIKCGDSLPHPLQNGFERQHQKGSALSCGHDL